MPDDQPNPFAREPNDWQRMPEPPDNLLTFTKILLWMGVSCTCLVFALWAKKQIEFDNWTSVILLGSILFNLYVILAYIMFRDGQL